MKKKIFILCLTVFVLLMCFWDLSPVKSQNEQEVQKAVSYLKLQEQSAWTTMALAGAGEAGLDLSHLAAVPQDQRTATTYAKYILSLTAAGKNPTAFGDEDYVEKLKSYHQDQQFGEKNLINDDIWSVLALSSVGQQNLSIAQKAKDYILNNQNADGGWGYEAGGDSDTNDTAAAIMALLEAGVAVSSLDIEEAVNYLKAAQSDDGGFPYFSGSGSDSCSDAWVISAVYRLAQDPGSQDWSKGEKDALKHLKSLQDDDGGFWWQAKGDNKFCSAYGLIALLAKHYPVDSIYTEHRLRIEGQESTICDALVSGGTAMDLVIAGSDACDYDYSISEFQGMGLYLAELQGEESWMYLVNKISPMLAADSYYLKPGDEVVWYSGPWLQKGWLATKVRMTETESSAEIQVQFYNSSTTDWQNLEAEGLKVKIGSTDFTTDAVGRIEVALASLEDGFYYVFAETQVINDVGYIRSEKEGLKVGGAPKEHSVGLRAEIERIEAPCGGEQAEISFSVTPDTVDFGLLKPGQNSTQFLTVANGDTGIYLEAVVSGADIFQDTLEIDEKFWQIFSLEMEAGQGRTMPVKLIVPSTYQGDFGSVQGELTFWAIQK